MATELSRDQLRRLARLGAEKRIEELRREEAAIRAAFPDLGANPATSARGKRGRRGTRAAAAPAAPPKKAARYKMSAAQKRAVSERMKKYWAARRKAKG